MEGLKIKSQDYNDYDKTEAEIASAAAWNSVYYLDREIRDKKFNISVKNDDDGPSVSGDLPASYMEAETNRELNYVALA